MMTTLNTLLLINADPSHPLAWHAYRYAKTYLATQGGDTEKDTGTLHIFFYGDAAQTGNILRWQTADQPNLTTLWTQLSEKYQKSLPICVSTALTRGVTDEDNAKRHQLSGENLANGFKLVGLGELAEKLTGADKVISF